MMQRQVTRMNAVWYILGALLGFASHLWLG